MENPGYALARHAFLAAGGEAVPVPVDPDGLVTDALPPARLVYVTPSHQYPLGGVLSAPRRRALLAWAASVDGYVVEDDYDGEYRHDVAPIPPVQTLNPQAVIYAGTVSKTLSPTLRLGYLVLPAALLQAFVEAKRLTDRHAPLLEQEALAELLASGAYERHVRSIRRRNAERRSVLLAALAESCGQAVRSRGPRPGSISWSGSTASRRPGRARSRRPRVRPGSASTRLAALRRVGAEAGDGRLRSGLCRARGRRAAPWCGDPGRHPDAGAPDSRDAAVNASLASPVLFCHTRGLRSPG